MFLPFSSERERRVIVTVTMVNHWWVLDIVYLRWMASVHVRGTLGSLLGLAVIGSYSTGLGNSRCIWERNKNFTLLDCFLKFPNSKQGRSSLCEMFQGFYFFKCMKYMRRLCSLHLTKHACTGNVIRCMFFGSAKNLIWLIIIRFLNNFESFSSFTCILKWTKSSHYCKTYP